MKKLIMLIFLLVVLSTVSFSLDMTKDYSARELNELMDTLEESFDGVTVEVLGESYLGQPIKVIQVKNPEISFKKDMRYNTGIHHFLVIGGVHGRERVNPKLLIKQAEYYVSNDMIPRNIVIHYIPLVNPDGYDLSLFEGLSTKFLKGIDDNNYPRWKSNIRGVDINRNFKDIYLDLESYTWEDSWGRVDNKRYKSEVPSGEYYFGPYAGSEIETQILMNYMNKYKYEMSLDYHSQGEVLFVKKWFMSEDFNEKSMTLAQKIMDINGYIKPRDDGEYSSGFTTNYMANRHRVPSITVETTKTRNLPYLSEAEQLKAYEENKDVTLEVFKKAVEMKTYGDYKTYDQSGYFFDEYKDVNVAKAYAKKYDLMIKTYKGMPLEHLDDFVSQWAIQSINELVNIGILSMDLSRGYQSNISIEIFLDSLQRINQERYLAYEKPRAIRLFPKYKAINRLQASYILYTYLDGHHQEFSKVDYEDIDYLLDKHKQAIYFVNQRGLINGFSRKEFRPMSKLTKEEAAVILLRLLRLENKGAFTDE